MRHVLVLAVTALTLSFALEAVSRADPAGGSGSDQRQYKDKVLPILQSACVKCHSADKPKGDFRIDNLNPDLLKGADADKWEEVLNQLQTGSMPPKSEKGLSKSDREVVTGWVQGEMRRAEEARASTGGRGVIRRLTRYEYNYTLQDLMELPLDVTKMMPDERADPSGLKNNGKYLGMSTSQLEMYVEAATVALDKAMVSPSKPEVHHSRFTADQGEFTALKMKSRESDHVASGPGVKLADGVKLPPGAFDQFYFSAPRTGRFRISVVAGGESDLEGNHPRLQVWFGYQSTASLLVREMIAEITVDAPLNSPKEYVIYGYLEDCPMSPKTSDEVGKKAVRGKDLPTVLLMHAYDAEHGKAQTKGGPGKKGSVKPDGTSEHKHTILLKSFDFQAPYFETWPPKSRTAVLGAAADAPNPASRARETIAAFASRAWRRPVTSEDVDPFVKMFEAFYKDSKSFDAAIRETLTSALLSPNFLYVIEPIGDARRNLTAHELASRLSYFLWCSLPDAELRKLADSGEILKDAVLTAQVQRMLADPKARRFAKNFTEQWLEADQVDRVAVNPEYFPGFKDELKKSLRREPTELFWHILSNDRSAMEFLSSDYVVVDQALAAHYGLKGVIGSDFRPLKVRPEDHRGGLLTMGCFLLANSNGAESHPIMRGKWLLKNLMNEPPPMPPPGVPELSQIKGFEKMTLKSQLEVHRSNAACAVCHNKLDPWGLALENLDAVGHWRTTAKKIEDHDEAAKAKGKAKPPVAITSPVDATVKLPDDTLVKGVDELKQYCVRVKGADFSRALTRKLLAYALGRSLEWTDRSEVDKLTKSFAESQFKLQTLITDIVLSNSFRTR